MNCGFASFAASLLLVPALCGQAAAAQPLLGAASAPGRSAYDAPDAALYADGTRAINEGRWADAVSIFSRVAAQHEAHADGALYWKAYAENKQGHADRALTGCAELRSSFPSSTWLEDCGALEIEIRANAGKPVQPAPVQDEDLKLLALNSLMHQDEPRALAQIQEILKGDGSDQIRERAIFILAQGTTKPAHDLLHQIADGDFDPQHPAPALQSRAAALVTGRPPTLGSPYPEGTNALTLDVVVTDKSGSPVSGLQASDFKLLDNQQPQSILSVLPANGAATPAAGPPVEVMVLIDAVNPTFLTVANERQWITRFLSENGGRLTLPTSLVIVTDNGIRMTTHPTHDGRALSQFLDANPTGFRAVRRSEGRDGAVEREQTSLNALDYLAVQASKRPGRKLLIWISPGWHIFSAPSWDGGPRAEKILFNYVVSLSTALRAARMTLYSIDPAGEGRGEFFYLKYLKGVDGPKHADYGDLILQVLATQSGGQVLFGSNDLASLIDRCVADAASYYVVTAKPPPAGHADEYHALDVQVINRPDLKVRTRAGYYAQPSTPTDQQFPTITAQK